MATDERNDTPSLPEDLEAGRLLLTMLIRVDDDGADPLPLLCWFDRYPDWRDFVQEGLAKRDGASMLDGLNRAGESNPMAARISAAVAAVVGQGASPQGDLDTPEETNGQAQCEPAWPKLDEMAFQGLAGDIVGEIEPHTEADLAALLVQFLVTAGSVIGRGPYFQVEADWHHLNLFAILVGATSKGRKGTSWGHVRRLFQTIDLPWAKNHVISGLSSGEGLMYAVRDPAQGDPGVVDKRLLVIESEFASVLRVQQRRENTLSALIRQAWDMGDLRTLTRNNPMQATAAHVSIIGHITERELRRELTRTDMANGLANRFLFVVARRSKLLPRGGRIDQVNFEPLVKRLQKAIEFAQDISEMTCDADAEELWTRVYPTLSEGKPGLLGAVTSRAEAQVLRLQCIYALLDGSAVVKREHLEAALAVWRYCEASAQHIFGDSTGDDDADTILQALRSKPAGLTRTSISELFGRNAPAARISRALRLLQDSGLAAATTEETGGRPAERWLATKETK